MALFKKNPNEVNYPEGKKTFLSVIKSEGSPESLIWKVPYEDFNVNSRLIVSENEDALFWKNGVVEEIFSAGEYVLDTNNYPFLSRIKNSLSGGVSIYNCKVYYVNKAHKLDMKWGTDGPIQVVDKVHGIATTLMSRGSFTVQVKDSKKFFLKYVGPNIDQLGPADVISEFRAPFNQSVKSSIGRVVKSMDDEIIGICSRQDEIADMIKPVLDEVLDEYGIRLVNFYISALEIADDESRKQLEAARADRVAMSIRAQGEKARLDTLGITFQESASAEILNNMAKNEGNPLTGAGAGLGFGIAAGGAFGNMAGNMMMQQPMGQQGQQPVQQNQPCLICPGCRATVPMNSKFCPECGFALVRNCPKCGNPLEPTAKFCPECGERIS